MKLELIIINSLMIAGIHVLFWPGMILAPLRKYLMPLPLFIRKPLFDCLICMSSIWGVAFFLSLIFVRGILLGSTFFLCWNGLPLKLFGLVPHVLAVCGCNLILDSCIHYWRREFITNSEVPSFEAPEAKDKLK